MVSKKTSRLQPAVKDTKVAARTEPSTQPLKPELEDRYRGLVAVNDKQEIHGWAIRTADNTGGLVIGLFAADKLVAMTVGNIFRPDVRDAGLGNGKAGFLFLPTPEMLKAISKGGGVVDVRIMDQPGMQLAKLALLGSTEFLIEPDSKLLDAFRPVLAEEFETIWRLSKQLDETGPLEARPALKAHNPLFSTAELIPNSETPEERRLPAYLEYVRHRMRVDASFDIEGNPEEPNHFVDFYLKAYGAHRRGLRTPLSKSLIDYLNQPVVMGGQRISLARYVWWRLLENPSQLAQLQLNSIHSFDSIAYWWAWHEARALHVEDCLVPASMVQRLRSVRPERRTEKWQLTLFMEFLHQSTVLYHFLDQAKPQGRFLFSLSLMVTALQRPDILRYLPQRTVAKLLEEPEGGSCALAQFVSLIGPVSLPEMTRQRYKELLRVQGYDLDSNSFTSLSADGNRLHAAMLPAVAGDARVDVQLIGPFKKASGLGQATRLSAEILKHTSFSLNFADFGMDNPAPEGFSSDVELDDFKPAKVNLIHLNAESIPLLYAYGPDVMSGAYNIGYFFWELETPALAHYLGMELLDEIWVSTEYGVQIYRPETGKPVINVGMCYEELPEIDKAEARSALDRRFNLNGDEFVVFTAFDSFSFTQRKNPIAVITAFQRAFADNPEARLIVKTQNRDFVDDPKQRMIWQRIDSFAERDPRILIMNETLAYEDLLALKAASDCYISLHRSEGWGFGMIEAMNLKVPVVCTGYSGNMDFCSAETCWLVDYTEATLEREDYIFVRRGQKWAEPDINHAARQLRALYDDPEDRSKRVEAAFYNVSRNFSSKAIARRYESRLSEILK